jgi:hypothetical protein
MLENEPFFRFKKQVFQGIVQISPTLEKGGEGGFKRSKRHLSI